MLDRAANRRRGPRTAWLLVALAILPLVGVGLIIADDYQRLRRTDRIVDRVIERSSEVRRLDELQLALSNEHGWLTSIRGVESLSFPLSLVDELVGLDLVAEYEAAVQQTDVVLSRRISDIDPADIEAMRRLESDGPGSGAFAAIDRELRDRSSEIRSSLVDEVSSLTRGADLLSALSAAEHAHFARLTHSEMLWTFFSAEGGAATDPAAAYLDLATHAATVQTTLALIEGSAQRGTTLATSLDALQESPDVQLVSAAVEEVLRRTLDDADADSRSLLERATGGAATYRAGAATIPAFDALVEASSVAVVDAGDAARESAAAELRRKSLVLVVAAAASVSVAAGLARYLGRPMRRLAADASKLGRDQSIAFDHGGPREVRRIAEALESAADDLLNLERLEHEATHDELTGVPTRRLVDARIEAALARARRTGGLGAVMFVDIDHFKQVNDRHGHAVGDVVLATMTERLRQVLRTGDELGRYGGDEFVVLAEPVSDERSAVDLAERLLAAAAEPVDARCAGGVDIGSDGQIVVTLSIGLAMFGGVPMAAEDVLRRADHAVYQAKAAGRNTVVSVDVQGEHRSLEDPRGKVR